MLETSRPSSTNACTSNYYCKPRDYCLLLSSAMIIVHSENSTAQPEWHPNAVQRGTWAIYQTCIVTIILCVWTTIHLNIPRPGEKSSRQTWRKVGWSLLTIIAPEVVALNAWYVLIRTWFLGLTHLLRYCITGCSTAMQDFCLQM